MWGTTASLLLSRLTPGSVERISAVNEMRRGWAARTGAASVASVSAAANRCNVISGPE